MPRPLAQPKNDTEVQVEKLSEIGCTWAEISAVIGMTERTLRRRFGHSYTKGYEVGKKKLRETMWEIALRGNVTMCIWLSKQYLGMSEKIEEKTEVKLDDKRIVEIQWGDEIDSTTQDAEKNTSSKENQSVKI